jgi:NodT family efflux transporter outer membrane factor (OMF) lipoprotein
MLALTLAAGCVLPPKDQPQLKPIPDKALGLGSTPAPKVENGWWQAYGDPQLDQLVTGTLKQNPSLGQALARIRVAQAQAQYATAESRPGVTLEGQAQRERYPEKFIYPPPFGGGVYWQSALQANLSWDLDFWGRQAALIQQARDQADAARLDAAAAALAISGALSQAYVDLYRADAHADLAAREEQQRQQILDITRRRVAAGLDTDVELHQAESALPQARLAALQAQAAADLAVHRLAALAGMGADAYAGIHKPTVNLEAALPVPAQLPADLLGRRPDVLAARARVEASRAGLKAAKAAFYPDINLSVFAGFQAIGLGNLLQMPDSTYGAGPALSLPLFKSIRLTSRYREATAAEDAAIADYNDTVLQAVQQVADQLTLLRSGERQLAEARAARSAAEAAYDLDLRRYKAGLASYLSVLSAETAVLQTRREEVDTLTAQAIARVALLLYCGGSFDPAVPAAAPAAAAAATPPHSLAVSETRP